MDSTSTDKEDAGIITYMDSSLYEAAAEGRIFGLNKDTEHLDQLLTPNKNTVLHIFIRAQCCRETESALLVGQILDKCPSLLLQANSKGETPLHIAARHGLYWTVNTLIRRAKALHKEDLKRGDEEARQMLRMSNIEKDTALHEAVRYNHHSVVVLLTKEDPEFAYSANDAGETPLYLAVERGFYDPAYRILGNCTSPPHGGPNGRTALHAAVIGNDKGMMSLKMVKRLLEWKRALTKEADQQGWTPLHYAAHLGDVSMVELLLNYDKSVAYFADRDGKRTALLIAAGHGHTDIMKELISCCPDCCELVDKRGWNVLHFAVQSGDESAVQVILENSSLINLLNEKDNDGNTPLHRLAASLCYIPALIEHPKVNKTALNKKGLSPLDISLANEKSSEKKESIIRDLKNAGARAGRQNITYKDDGGI